jgi:antitoxin PrlF
MSIATMTSKGQVTIPKEVREIFGLHSGDKLDFSCDQGGRIVVTPIKKNVDDLFGKLYKPERKALSTDAIHEAIRQKFRQQKL